MTLERRTWTLPIGELEERIGWYVIDGTDAVEFRALAGPGDSVGDRKRVGVRGRMWAPDGIVRHTLTERPGWVWFDGVCQIHGSGKCWADFQQLPSDVLLSDWAEAGTDDRVIWERLERMHGETFGLGSGS